jgi:hypothetical protein
LTTPARGSAASGCAGSSARARSAPGAQISPTALGPGRDRIVLVARDRFGRTGRASVLVTLRAARPLFLVLSAPKRVKRSARSLKLKVRSSLDAQLAVRVAARAKQQGFSVSRRLRTLTTLGLPLSADGLTRTQTVSVRR